MTPPACWADLIKPEYKGEVQMADPNSSGTAWTMLATIVQLMGEDKAFEYLKALHRNINEYTKAGAAPALATGQGETLVGIAFQHDVIDVAEHSKPVAVVSPCEGTGYEIGSMSLIAKGAKHMDEAKKFYDWALTPEAQKIAATTGSFQIPSNPATPVPPEAPDLSQDQADRIRLRQVWLLGRNAQAPARQVDQRGEERAEVAQARVAIGVPSWRAGGHCSLPAPRAAAVAILSLIAAGWRLGRCWSCRGTVRRRPHSPPPALFAGAAWLWPLALPLLLGLLGIARPHPTARS